MKNVGDISVFSRMKLPTFFFLLSSFFFLQSCSNDGEVSVSGRILHMNQADFFVYSPDGVIDGIDTIHVMGGRFEFESPILKEGTLVVVFPNYSQLPLFVKDGSSISIEGDASKIRNLEVSGGSDNKAFTQWRADNADATDKVLKVNARQFVAQNPDSPVSIWMIRNYFVMCQKPDIKGALSLLDGMIKAAPNNLAAKKMRTQIALAGIPTVNDKIGHFSAVDIHGKSVNEQFMKHGNTAIITLASWSYDSQSMLRSLASRMRHEGTDSKATPIDHILVVSLDADIKECRRTVKNCNADNATVICDGQQFESSLLRILHLTTIPDNVLVKNGKVVKSHLPTDKL